MEDDEVGGREGDGDNAIGSIEGGLFGCGKGDVLGCSKGDLFGCSEGDLSDRREGDVLGCSKDCPFVCSEGDVLGCAEGERCGPSDGEEKAGCDDSEGELEGAEGEAGGLVAVPASVYGLILYGVLCCI